MKGTEKVMRNSTSSCQLKIERREVYNLKKEKRLLCNQMALWNDETAIFGSAMSLSLQCGYWKPGLLSLRNGWQRRMKLAAWLSCSNHLRKRKLCLQPILIIINISSRKAASLWSGWRRKIIPSLKRGRLCSERKQRWREAESSWEGGRERACLISAERLPLNLSWTMKYEAMTSKWN